MWRCGRFKQEEKIELAGGEDECELDGILCTWKEFYKPKKKKWINVWNRSIQNDLNRIEIKRKRKTNSHIDSILLGKLLSFLLRKLEKVVRQASNGSVKNVVENAENEQVNSCILSRIWECVDWLLIRLSKLLTILLVFLFSLDSSRICVFWIHS